MADPDAFLARWSRLKRKAKAEARDAEARSGAARPQHAEPAPAPTLPTDAAPPPEAPKPAQALPPIDSLGRDSDYTPFMRADVPDELRNQALRKLWQSDPVFANLDGLVEYGEDFGAAFALGGAVATVYRVLEGMPGPAAKDSQEERTGQAAAPPEGASALVGGVDAGDPPISEQEAAARPAGPEASGRKEEVELD